MVREQRRDLSSLWFWNQTVEEIGDQKLKLCSRQLSCLANLEEIEL